MLAGLTGSPAASVGDTMRGLENVSGSMHSRVNRREKRRPTLEAKLGRVIAGARHGKARGREESLDGLHGGISGRANKRLLVIFVDECKSQRSMNHPSLESNNVVACESRRDLGIRRQRHLHPSLAHRASPAPDALSTTLSQNRTLPHPLYSLFHF